MLLILTATLAFSSTALQHTTRVSFSSHRTRLQMSASSDAEIAKARLREALCSPSGKLTFSPEIIISEPTDPTALLLQATNVKKLSEQIRTAGKANAAWLSGSVNAVSQFTTEQESARGNFPGPLPVIYTCGTDEPTAEQLESIAEAGASGILFTVGASGKTLSSVSDLESEDVLGEDGWKRLKTGFDTVLSQGMQPIPEFILSPDASLSEEDVDNLVEKVRECCEMEPACVVLTVDDFSEEAPTEEEERESEADEDDIATLPIRVSKQLKKAVPILGSVRTLPGNNRVGKSIERFREAGFTGSLLRRECLPGYRINDVDLEFVGGFWSSVISQLKSTKSKSFGFRAKVTDVKNSVPMEWAKLTKSVVESGALGEADSGPAVDSGGGDYVGF